MLTETLRAETSNEHEAIETVPRLKQIFTDGFTRERYLDLLKKLYGFYAAFEARLDTYRERLAPLNPPQRAKTPLLEKDLNFFGLTSEEVEQLPQYQGAFTIGSFEDALGYLYVTEGATHGGQIMAKRIDDSLNLGGQGGVSFYASYGKEMMPMWRNFKQYLDAISPETDGEAVVEAARQTFGAMNQWLRS